MVLRVPAAREHSGRGPDLLLQRTRRSLRRRRCPTPTEDGVLLMPATNRILDAQPVPTLVAYLDSGGGQGLAAARALGPAATIDEVTAAGIRGRGGAGFPTGVKWRTVAANASDIEASTVVVNAAEGEPGSFKDRELLDRNPYRVLEGAL